MVWAGNTLRGFVLQTHRVFQSYSIILPLIPLEVKKAPLFSEMSVYYSFSLKNNHGKHWLDYVSSITVLSLLCRCVKPKQLIETNQEPGS